MPAGVLSFDEHTEESWLETLLSSGVLALLLLDEQLLSASQLDTLLNNGVEVQATYFKKSLFGEGIGVISNEGSITSADSFKKSSSHGSESLGVGEAITGKIAAKLVSSKLSSILPVLLLKEFPNIVLYCSHWCSASSGTGDTKNKNRPFVKKLAQITNILFFLTL